MGFQTDRQTDRLTDCLIDRQTDRQTNLSMEVNQRSNYTIKSQFFRQTFLIIIFKSIKYNVPVTHTLLQLLSAAAEC